jgi:hypothetical protein
MIKRISVLLLSLALALPAAIPLPAAAPAIGPTRPAGTASGVAWLLARQDAGGGWTNVAGLTARDTAVVVEALAALGQTGGLERGAAWLAGREPAPTDLLARAVRALQAAGRADADLEAALAAASATIGAGASRRHRSAAPLSIRPWPCSRCGPAPPIRPPGRRRGSNTYWASRARMGAGR